MILMQELWEGRIEIAKDCLQTLGTWLFYVFLALLALAVLAVIVACVWEAISQRNVGYVSSSKSDCPPKQGVPQDDHWSSGMSG